MAVLDLDFELPLRDFELTLALAVERTVALVGPSGAGKTSALHVVAGLARAKGRVALDGEVWLGADVDLRPEERRVGLVFQDYALFPHLSVRANVAYAGPVGIGMPAGRPGSPAGLVGGWTLTASLVPSRVVRYV